MENDFSFFNKSSLNLFYMNNGKIYMATAIDDRVAPNFAFGEWFPTERTSGYYKVSNCQHEYIFLKNEQIARGDEQQTAIFECNKCKKIIFNYIPKK